MREHLILVTAADLERILPMGTSVLDIIEPKDRNSHRLRAGEHIPTVLVRVSHPYSYVSPEGGELPIEDIREFGKRVQDMGVRDMELANRVRRAYQEQVSGGKQADIAALFTETP